MRSKYTIVAVILALSINIALAGDMDDCVAKLTPMYQGNCISDYAVVATAAVELSWCLKDKTKFGNIKLSAQDLICNCKDCHTIKGNGCMGGDISKAFDHIKNNNIVGGSYSNFGTQAEKTIPTGGPTGYRDCLNYWTKICDPTQETDCNTAPYDPTKVDNCPTNCNRKTGATVAASKVTGALQLAPTPKNDLTSIKASVTSSKVVVSSMEIFEDMEFFLGTTKVYVHSNGQSLGVVNVIIIGHDTDAATGMKYWTVLVPWDKKYSDGINAQKLRVVAEINHCNIENGAFEIRVASS